MNSILKYWIAESESWQSFIDFQIPEEAKAKYQFLRRTNDFYLSLMHNCLKSLNQNDIENREDEILSIAKGLEIFSLEKKRDHFNGINHSNNILFSASLYFLAGYSASAWILAKIYPKDNYNSNIDVFISNFLRRELDKENKPSKILLKFFDTGDLDLLKRFYSKLSEQTDKAFNVNQFLYSSFLLATTIVKKFSNENIWFDLLQQKDDVEFWKPYVQKSIRKSVPIWNFFPSQRKALFNGVLSESTFSLQMPTSAGKTAIAELIIYNDIKSDSSKKVLYLAPFRALASELKSSLARELASLGIKSKTIYGGNLPTVEERNSLVDVDLLISTPEKFMAIEDVFPGIQKQFSTIICDEGHLLDDESRGLSYELLLSRLKQESNSQKKFIFISAIIPNIDVINSWLGGEDETLITSDYRPTQLEYGFLYKMQSKSKGYYLDVNPTMKKPQNYQLYRYLSKDELKIQNSSNNSTTNITSKKGLSIAVSIKATKAGSVALFAPHKRGHSGVEGLAEEAVKQLISKDDFSLTDFSPIDYIDHLSDYFALLFGSDYLLVQASKLGFLYHHGDFPQGVREIIEDAVRNGFIRLIICTNTLAEGVNLPLKTIVIHSTKRFNPNILGNYEDLNIRDLKNIVGRAGRATKETKGLIIVPHSDDFKIILDLINENGVEPVRGQLYNIIQRITNFLKEQRLKISEEILDELDEYFQSLLDSIDLSMIDLLAEEVDENSLNDLVKQLVSQTLSYFQSEEDEKETLENIFEVRAEKLKPIIASGEFRILKESGTTLRLFNDIKENVNLDNEIWQSDIEIMDESWLQYILDESLYELLSFSYELDLFNEKNRCDLSFTDVKKSIELWMNGYWYNEISYELELEMHNTLRLINNFLSYSVQSIISSIIRVKELNDSNTVLSDKIKNWPILLQNGVNTQLKQDIFEMGLIDRVAVLGISKVIDQTGYEYIDYKNLRNYLIDEQDMILSESEKEVPWISINKIKDFLNQLKYKELL